MKVRRFVWGSAGAFFVVSVIWLLSLGSKLESWGLIVIVALSVLVGFVISLTGKTNKDNVVSIGSAMPEERKDQSLKQGGALLFVERL